MHIIHLLPQKRTYTAWLVASKKETYTFLRPDRLIKCSWQTNPLSSSWTSQSGFSLHTNPKENGTSPNHILFSQVKEYICILFLKVLVMTPVQFSVESSMVLCCAKQWSSWEHLPLGAVIAYKWKHPLFSFSINVLFCRGKLSLLNLVELPISYLCFRLSLPWGEHLTSFSNLSNKGVPYLTSSL